MEQLRKEGWNINETFAAKFFSDEAIPKMSQEILKTILDEDLREFGEPSIINLHRKEENTFEGPCVLQLLRFRNVSVPRIKEEMNQADPAHSIIRLFLTDGHTSISAVILEPISGINAETPPGTKILLIGKTPVEGGFLLLTKKDVKVMGGRVEQMIEKWNVERNSVRADGFKARNVTGKGTGAPKWVSFGKRGQKSGQLEKGFKANSVMPKNIKEGEEADDFAKNREQVLKEIDMEQAKTFAKPNVAPPTQKEKAPPVPKEPKEPKPRKEFKRRGRKNSEDGPDIDVGEYANHKPSGAVTLFDFIGGPGKEDVVGNLEKETSKMKVSTGGGRQEEKKSGRGGAFESKNEYGRGEGSSRKGDRNQQNAPFGRGSQDARGLRSDAKGFQEKNIKNQNTFKNDNPRKQQNQDRSAFAAAQPPSGRPNPRGNQNQAHQSENFQKEVPPRVPYKSKNFQKGPPRGPSQAGFSHGNDRGSHQTQHDFQNTTHEQAAHQRQRQPQIPYQKGAPRGAFPHPPDFQRPPTRGPQQHLSDFQRESPRGPPQRLGDVQRGSSQNDSHRRPPRGNQNQNNAYQNNHPGSEWRVGSHCLAPWTDGALYPATITQLFPDRRCTVQFDQYGTFQTIQTDFLIFN